MGRLWVAVAVVLAGCSVPDDGTQSPTFASTTPSTADPGLEVTLALEPRSVHPGETLLVRAEAKVTGSGPFRYTTCEGDDWTLRIQGEQGPVFSQSGNNHYCSSGTQGPGQRELPAGAVDRFNFSWIPEARHETPPGTYTVHVAFRGVPASATVTLLGPLLTLETDSANLYAGQEVVVRAILSNPSSLEVEVAPCDPGTWVFTMTSNVPTADPGGPALWSYEPPQEQAACPYPATMHLEPGVTVERSFTWDGKQADGSYPPDAYYFANVDVQYTEGGTARHIHADTSVYVCPRTQCPPE